MGDVVNLRRVRKKRDRSEAERLAERNRADHGRGKADRQAAKTARERAESFVEGHRLDEDGG